mgnify:CR=1 FL=1
MLSLLKVKLIEFCESGIPANAELEIKRKIFILNLFALVGSSITGVLGVTAFFHNDLILSSSLIISCTAFYASHLYLKITNNYKAPARGLLFALSVLMLYLVYSGGVENTGPLWIFIIPPVALFLGGLTSGLVSIFLFIGCCIFLMFYEQGSLLATDYPQTFKLRLIYSFLTVTFLSYCYEYSRKLSFKNIQDLSEEFERMAKHDALTGLSNRRDMMEKIQTECARVSRSHNQTCLLLCDIDHFKVINDTYGHDAGDQVLEEISDLFSSMIRQQDLVARWGGEEFLFVLPDTHLANAQKAAENIREKVETHAFMIGDVKKHITISIGVATLSVEQNIKESIARADKYLYRAKQTGRNRVCSSINTAKEPATESSE